MKQITKVRKTVCAMANQLRKAGYSLKEGAVALTNENS